MQNGVVRGLIAMCAMAVLLGFSAQARTFEFKQFKSTGSSANSEYYWMGTEKSKSAWFKVKIGGATKIDDTSEMEIRAATVLKNVKDRKTGVNDIAKFKFDPINKGKAIYFMVSSGVALSLERDKYWYGNDGRANRGWQLAGCIIEIWQKGKVVKHWSGAGNAGKTRLADGIPLLRINKDGYASEGDRNRFNRDFDNATEIFSVDAKGERVDIDDVLQPYRESEDDSDAESEKKSAKKDDSADEAPVKNVVAQKLRQCDFLLNEKFKKKAKFYLCLFSASWCPPCRAEMPRIAETYAETLKDDPDIELIHFSRDQDDEKALAWAKEHDVKFPVVKPQGGNPLDLHTRGIPHLFIVKADGTLVEEGHPMRIFNEEKFREIKGGDTTGGVKHQEDKGSPIAIEGVANVTTEGGLFTLTGPYGIRMTADPGCEKGAEYVMKKLVERYLPRAKEFYGDPFLGEKPTRVYRIDVDQNDGLGNSTYTGPSYRPGTGSWSIGLSKGAERYEMSLDYLASSVLTLCEEPKWASFVFYVNRLVEAKAKGIDATPRLKEDIRRGLEESDENGKNNWYRSHAPLWAALEDLRTKHPRLIFDYCALKNKRFAEGRLPKKLSYDQMAALLSEVSGENASELFGKYGVKNLDAKRVGSGGNSSVSAKSRRDGDYSKGEKGTASVDGITWSYSIQDGEATIASPTGKLYERAVAPQPVGDVSIPTAVNGTPVTGIGKFALCNCPELASVKIPNSVKHIDEWAFSGCRKLTSVTVPSSVDNIGKCVFASCPQLVEINVDAGNSKYVAVDGVVYTRDMKCLETGVGGLTSVNIPIGVEEIDREAFRCCRELRSVTIPPSVKKIGREAFLASGLKSVVIPSSVSRIEPWAFWCCTGLNTVTIDEGVSTIGSQAFYQCRSLKEVSVPKSVKCIESGAFKDCERLVSVTMNGDLPDTGGDIFAKCDSLKAIHVPSNAKSWAGMKEWQGVQLVFDAETK